MFKCGHWPRDMKNLVVLVTFLWLSYSEGCLLYRIATMCTWQSC